MSPKATEGVGTTGRDVLLVKESVGAPRETTPSGLPAISPSRGEIEPPSHPLRQRHRQKPEIPQHPLPDRRQNKQRQRPVPPANIP